MPSERVWRKYLSDVPSSWSKLSEYIHALVNDADTLAIDPKGLVILHNLFSRECRHMPNPNMRHSPNIEKEILVDFLNELGNDIGGIASLKTLSRQILFEIMKETAEKFSNRFYVMGIRKPKPDEECDTIMPLRHLGWRYPDSGYADLPAVGTNSNARMFQYLIERGRLAKGNDGFRLQKQIVRPECIASPTWVYNRHQMRTTLKQVDNKNSPNYTAIMRNVLGLTYTDRNWIRINYPDDFFLNPPIGIKVANPTFIDGGHDPKFRPRVFHSVSNTRGWGETVDLRSINYQAGVEEAVHKTIQVHPDGFDLENLPPCELDAVDVDYSRLLKASKSEVQ